MSISTLSSFTVTKIELIKGRHLTCEPFLKVFFVILNAGSLSSEHFLLWACLIEKKMCACKFGRVLRNYMKLHNSSIKSLKHQTLYARVSSSYHQSMAIIISDFNNATWIVSPGQQESVWFVRSLISQWSSKFPYASEHLLIPSNTVTTLIRALMNVKGGMIIRPIHNIKSCTEGTAIDNIRNRIAGNRQRTFV